MSRTNHPQDSQSGEGGFLSRWSQRKQAARSQPSTAEAPQVDARTPADDEAAARRAEEQERKLAENQAAAEAVDLETLGFDSDYSVFLKEGVSTHLKNAALRKLWNSNPVLACVDGLNDYDHDFRTLAAVAEKVQTSWQVGKGYGWMREEAEAEEALRAAEATGGADAGASELEQDSENDAARGPADDHAETLDDPDRAAESGAVSDAATTAAPADDPGDARDTTRTGQAGAAADGTGSDAPAGAFASRTPDPVPIPARPARRRVTFT